MRMGFMSRLGRWRLLTPKIIVLALLSAGSCSGPPAPSNPDLSIELRWIKSYSGESRSDVETGLLWALSFLGATLPIDGRDPFSWHDNIVTLHLDHAGIGAGTQPAWEQLLASMKAGEEYTARGALDIGRFVALTLCSSKHYYAVTGADARYEEAYANHVYVKEHAAIVESAVSLGERLIEIGTEPTVAGIAFVAHEGRGSVARGTFVGGERELIDIMPNGQLRFALYDTNGDLKPAADRAFTAAGKPSKCLWCHEIGLSRPFKGRTSVPGYVSLREFEDQIAGRMQELRLARSKLRSRIDFKRAQDHTYAELLYITFYEPSAERIAGEWNVPVAQVRETLSGLPTHAHDEFDFLGRQLYRRSDVDRLAPYRVLAPPTDPREPSAYEPDFLGSAP